MKAALGRFNFESHTTLYAICPTCSCTYKPTTNHSYPSHCTNRPQPDAPICGAPLVQDPENCTSPTKSFVYHHFQDYIAGLLAGPDFEELVNQPCDDLAHNLSQTTQTPPVIRDVWDAEYLRSFKGPEPDRLFVDWQGKTHLLFSLNVDLFNIEENLQRNATTLCGIISCTCLNLPIDICYKPENMYLAGIIPDPTEPSGAKLNHFLEPIIDDFIDSWQRGVQFSRTSSNVTILTHSAIACILCDLPAARKTAQLASVTSHFYCSACHCAKLGALGQTDFDSNDWKLHDKATLCMYTEAYRDAPLQHQHKKLFHLYGVRWSPLWRLPYWDPGRQLVIDSMHCLLKGLTQAQFWEHLGLTATTANRNISEAELQPAFTTNFQPVDTPADTQILNEKSCKQVGAIEKLLTSAASSGVGKEDLRIQDHLTTLATKLEAKNGTALEFVAVGL